uniref:Odorant receptor n=1 Tax=Heliconius melpomene rosina TaxID=171916 RepID=A0A1S5XXP7_HELME|nr:olfactory receptor 51 [Heliconius melpomene rosina]AQQ73534.1 olfactory receptor 65 [Heliconius melpomene rosina]
MQLLNAVWRTLTNSEALRLASGKFEIYFFEFLYRVVYLCGLSIWESSMLYFIYSTTVKTLLVLFACGEVWQFFSITWTIDAVTDGLNLLLIQFGALCKYKITITNKSVFKKLSSSMESENFDISTSQRKNILATWRKTNKASLKLLLGIGTCTVIFWHIYPLVDDLEYNLMAFVRLPFKFQTPSLYPPTYLGMMVVFSYMCYFVMANDLIMQAHLMHLLCQFAVLNDCFENILTDCLSKFQGLRLNNNLHQNEAFTKEYKTRLGNLVKQHNFILCNTLKLRDLLSTPMLVQLAVSTSLICSIGFQVATSVSVNMTKWLTSLLYLAYNMFVLYIICRWCEEIKIQNENTGEAVYASGWESGIVNVPGVRTTISLIIARANKPAALTAGGMYDLSLKAYAMMVKTSYSALTVLLRLR